MSVTINDNAVVIPVDYNPSLQVSPVPAGSPIGLSLVFTAQPPPQPLTLMAAPPPPGNGIPTPSSPLQWNRVLGWELGSQGTGIVSLIDGAGVALTKFSFPGIYRREPTINNGLACTPLTSLQITSAQITLPGSPIGLTLLFTSPLPAAPNLEVVGHVIARAEPMWRSQPMGKPVGLLLALTNP